MYSSADGFADNMKYVENCGRNTQRRIIYFFGHYMYTERRKTPQSPVHCTGFCNIRILRLDLDIFRNHAFDELIFTIQMNKIHYWVAFFCRNILFYSNIEVIFYERLLMLLQCVVNCFYWVLIALFKTENNVFNACFCGEKISFTLCEICLK